MRLYVDYCHKKLLDTQEYICILNKEHTVLWPIDTPVIVIDQNVDSEFLDFIRDRFKYVTLDYYSAAPSIHPTLPS